MFPYYFLEQNRESLNSQFYRGVTQSGRVRALGARGRRFKSYRPDHFLIVPAWRNW